MTFAVVCTNRSEMLKFKAIVWVLMNRVEMGLSGKVCKLDLLEESLSQSAANQKFS